MARKRKKKCPLCGQEVREDLDFHYQCSRIIFQTNEIAKAYLSSQIEDWIRDFVRELDFVFKRDTRRARRYFNVAEEIVLKSVRDYGGGDLPKNDVLELANRDHGEVLRIFEILHFAKIARLDREMIHLEELGRSIAEAMPRGERLDSAEIRNALEEMRGAICVALAKSLIDRWLDGEKEYGRPRNYLFILHYISNLLLLYEDGPVPKKVRGSEIFIGTEKLFGVLPRQHLKFLKDVLGLEGHSPKVIESFVTLPGGKITVELKDTIVRYIERMRERYRERARER
jgi:hypothetical protein